MDTWLCDSIGLVRPIIQGETLLGTLAIGRKMAGGPFSPEQLEVIRTFTEFLSIQIVNAELQEKQVGLQVTAHELEIARSIQESLLPKFFPPIPGYGLAGFCLSARHVGGDFYDVFEVSRGRVLLVVADVMGKGIPAALFAATLHTLVRTTAEWTHQPAELLARMNRQMFDELSAVDMFITAQLLLIDTEEQLLTVASAGHCPLLINLKLGGIRAVSPEGLPLGILPRAIFAEETIPLRDCASVLLYTDGLTEARNGAGQFYGQQRLEQWLSDSQTDSRSAYELSWKFMADLKSFQSKATTADDQTFLILTEETPIDASADSASTPSLPIPALATNAPL
jgi:serine phosphatase RsbU (regulator of sigma subunit)